MASSAWHGDACSLVDAFRAGELTPLEALDGSLDAIAASNLNALAFLDAEAARTSATVADVSLPFGGVPVAIKELEAVNGWPATEASLVFRDAVFDYDSTQVSRLRSAGAVLIGQTTASEFGGINVTNTKLHGTTLNPWNVERTPGGSSGGSAAAVAGGLVPIASGGDGGGSIRIPAGFCGLFGLKATYGRIPRGPRVLQSPHTVTVGCLSRSVRDTARWLDVCNGYDSRDTFSLARVDGWEDGLGTHNLSNMRAVISLDLNSALVEERQLNVLMDRAIDLIALAGLRRVDVVVDLPRPSNTWAMSNLVGLYGELGQRYPQCHDDLTREIQASMKLVTERFDLDVAASASAYRTAVDEKMADVFDQADFIFAATNPDVAFPATASMARFVGALDVVKEHGLGRAVGNNGALTIPINLSGNPAVTFPAGTVDGLPVGLQVIGRHHDESLLLDLALMAERQWPWPLIAPLD